MDVYKRNPPVAVGGHHKAREQRRSDSVFPRNTVKKYGKEMPCPGTGRNTAEKLLS